MNSLNNMVVAAKITNFDYHHHDQQYLASAVLDLLTFPNSVIRSERLISVPSMNVLRFFQTVYRKLLSGKSSAIYGKWRSQSCPWIFLKKRGIAMLAIGGG